jgi:ATP-binding cassette subfamily B protein
MRRLADHPEPPDFVGSRAERARGFEDSLSGATIIDSSALLASELQDELTAVTVNPDQPVVILRVLVAGSPPRDIPLKPGKITLGRGKEVDVTLLHRSVSRQHLQLQIEGGRIIATDLGSSAGTFVDGIRISRPTPVVSGTTIALGEQRVELYAVQPRTSTPSALYLEQSRVTRIGPGLTAPLQTVAPPRDEPVQPAWRFSAPTAEDLKLAATSPFVLELDDQTRGELLAAAQRLDIDPGGVLLAPGQELEYLYLVLGGQLQLVDGGRSAGSMGQGDAVELLELLRGGRCRFEVRAEDTVSVLWIAAGTVRELVERDPSVAQLIARPLEWPGAGRFRRLLRDYAIPREAAASLIAGMTMRTVEAGTRLASPGDPVTVLQIVNRGAVTAAKSIEGVAAQLTQLTEGDLFGGPELCAGKPCAMAFDATSAAEIIEIERAVVLEALHRAPQLTPLLEAFRMFVPPPAPPAASPSHSAADDDDAEAPPVETFRKDGGTPLIRRPRPKFVRQHDEMDCGAACLAMMSQAYGRNISLATFRAKVHVTREGASMWSLVRAARATGFEVAGVQCGVEGMAKLQLPAIALTKYHYVVVYSVSKTKVVVGDPAVGLHTLSVAEFKAEASGMLLLMRPTHRLLQHPTSRAGWRKYMALSPGHLRPAIEIIVASFLTFALGIVTPLLTQVTFDRVIVNQDTGLLTTMVIAMSAVTVLSTITLGVRAHLTGYVANRFDTVFSALVYRYVMRLPLNFFMVRRIGDILTRFREIQNVRQFLTGDALNALIQVTSIGIYIVILFFFNTTLGLLALGLTPVVGATSVACSRRLRRLMQEGFPPQARAQGVMVEQLRALETVKSLGAEVAGRWRWEEAFRIGLKARLRVDKLRVIINAVSEGLEQLALTMLTFVAAKMAIDGELTIGTVIAVGMFASSIFAPVQTLAAQWTNLQSIAVGFGRIDDVITTSAEPSYEVSSRGNQRRLQGDIELRNVWFQYGSDLSPWVLKNINLTIKRGETVAFVGRSGSGKTTLVQLLNLLYRPTKGTILIDGTDVSTMNLGQLRDSIGMVMQDSHLFAGTVFDNVAFGQENASLELVMAAARVANAHGFISTMPDGYFSRLKEGGGGLSGGQRQRINLARALFRRPSILVLDEATSALDSESERAIVEAMKVYCRGRTSIVIAHRISTVLHADRIVLLDRGEIVEVGSHRELIARGGPYVQLFGAQLAL